MAFCQVNVGKVVAFATKLECERVALSTHGFYPLKKQFLCATLRDHALMYGY